MLVEGGSCGVSAKKCEYSCTHGAQINFGDLTPYLTYEVKRVCKCVRKWALNYSAGCPSGNVSRFFLTKFAKVSDQRTLARKSFVLIGRAREKKKDYISVEHQFFHVCTGCRSQRDHRGVVPADY